MSDAAVDFLHPNNVCGRTLLSLTARGSAILAELLRLSEHVPTSFTSSSSSSTSDSKYVVLLHDFRYLKSPELYDQKIDHDVELTELDEEFRESHFALLERFYRLFESIYRYFADYLLYLEELHEGVFVQHTIENVLEDREGGQLLCEALYLYGVMLLLMDLRIEGSTREKLIISYYRYRGAGTVHHFDEVVKLCRQTGFSPSKRPPNYPEELFARIRYPVEVVLLLISRLRADDLYNHTSAYPSPQHRSIAYAAQSSILYILLYFTPDLLVKKDAIMREIIDKHFPDNWVIPYYMGYTVDLSEAWSPYKAASGGLRNIMSKAAVEGEVKRHAQALSSLNADLDRLLMEGVLTAEFVLSNPRKLVEQVRNCNHTLRWLMLHRTTVHKVYRELVVKSVSVQELMRLMMHTAQFEYVLKEQLKALLDGKQAVWDECKMETKERLLELSQYYSGGKELTRVKRVESLVKWFRQLSDEIDTLDYSNSVLVGRKMTTLITALEEVTEFDAIDQNLQVKQFLSDCVAAETLVALADGTSLPIKEVQVGMEVLSYNAALLPGEKEGLAVRKVDAVMDRGAKECVELLFSDGRTLVCTPDHRIRTADGRWVEAQHLKVKWDEVAVSVDNEEVIDDEGASVYPLLDKAVYGVQHKAKVLPLFRVLLADRRDVGVRHVYDLSVPSPQGDADRSFVAAGVVVHNCREYLRKMVKTVNINVKVIGDLDVISDFAYAWDIINDYTPLLHAQIKNDPLTCLLLRSTFLKLASILNLPLIRISQANSDDDVSVADKYSTDLVHYVRGVLEVIPQSVFQLLDRIIHLQTNQLKPVPTKMERKFLADYAQLDLRFSLARFTHEISVFTQGILAIKATVMGIVRINPKQLLEDGIRKELVIKAATFFHDYLHFKQPGSVNDFEQRLTELGKKLDGFRLSFEYIQDFISVYGLKIWQEELSRIMNYNVEQECNSFLRKKIFDWQSAYQSDAVPIPQFPALLPDKATLAKLGYSYASQVSVNFMGRLTRELLNLTAVQHTVYVESMQGWYEKDNSELTAKGKKAAAAATDEEEGGADNREIVGIRTFSLLMRSIGIFGLTGMDKLICFMLVKELQDFVRLYRRIIIQNKGVENYILRLANELHPLTQFPMNAAKLYENALLKTNKLWPLFLDSVVRIGQYQLIRRQIANELNFSCKLDSKLLSNNLDTFNSALINDLQVHYARPDSSPNYPGRVTTILSDISVYLETSGINNPLTKIYITTQPLDHFPLVVFLFTLHSLQSLHYNHRRATLENNRHSKPPIHIDGAPLIIGICTLLKQFHSVHLHTYLGYLGQYVRAHISGAEGAAGPAGGAAAAKGGAGAGGREEVGVVLLYLEEFTKFSHVSRKAIDAMLPSYIFDRSVQPAEGR